MHPNIRISVSRVAAALIALLLGTAVLAQTGKAPAPTAQQMPVVRPTDGRTVVVEGKLAPGVAAKVENAFNRELPRDLRTYQVGEVITAADTAAKEGMAAGGPTPAPAAAKVKVTVNISCCPLRITITISW